MAKDFTEYPNGIARKIREGVENLRKSCTGADRIYPATRSFTHTLKSVSGYCTGIKIGICERIDDTVHHAVSRCGIAPVTMRPQCSSIFPRGGSREWNSEHGDAF